jgi:hypothetical protein
MISHIALSASPYFSGTEILRLDHNQLSGVIPSEIGNLAGTLSKFKEEHVPV